MTAKFTATLNTAQEVPKEKGAPSNAAGTFTATLLGTTLKWSLTFSHLTGPATAAHLHLGPTGKSGPVVVALCGPCTSPARGTTKVASPAVMEFLSGELYVNVHTEEKPERRDPRAGRLGLAQEPRAERPSVRLLGDGARKSKFAPGGSKNSFRSRGRSPGP